jgi:hypothetical protein
LNREQAAILLKGLESISNIDKNTVIYKSIKRDLENIIVIWDRRIKNEVIIREQKRTAIKSPQLVVAQSDELK